MLYICAMKKEEWKYIDDAWIAEIVEMARRYECEEYIDISWYNGAGWYDEYLRKVSGEA